MSAISKVKSFLSSAKEQWSTPAPGKYVPYKEVAAYSLCGTGVYFIISLVGQIYMKSSSMIVAGGIGIKPVDLQNLSVLTTLIVLFFAPARAMLFDNTRSKMGKFRPYIMYMGIPTALLSILFVYLPYERMEYDAKLKAVFIVFTLMQFFSPFYQTAYHSLVQVMSPNSSERAWLISTSTLIYSFSPTVINPVLPLIGGMDNIETYRIAFPIFCTLGVCISIPFLLKTKERIIVPKQHVQKMGFAEGLKKVSKNKYFWLINASNWIVSLSGYDYLFYWVFHYGMNNKYLLALFTTIKGEASTPGIVLGAPLTNKLGKKKIAIISILLQAACFGLMLTCFENYIMFFVLLFLKDMAGALSLTYLPAIKADVMDYQQYKTNDRLEGFIEQSGTLLGSIVTLGTGYVLPLIFERVYGLTDNYDDLFDAAFRNPILRVVILFSFVSTLLSVVPFFFYDLTEDKRSNMIRALKIRALFADFEDESITEEGLNETVTDIYEAVEQYNNETNEKKKKALKIAVDEFEKYKNASPAIWAMIEDRYNQIAEKNSLTE
ncbi:MAG: MFS transporter [Clostridia bacterium]|nr:MFS transporter [Clostridia bacterium]